MSVLGKIETLKPASVYNVDIRMFKRILKNLPFVFEFDCGLCGARRSGLLVDPVLTRVQEFECRDAHPPANCRTPALPKPLKREIPLRPGSLVSAPYDTRKHKKASSYWPAIIEPDPHSSDVEYMIPGKNPGSVKAYFCVYIFPEADINNFRGGWMKSRSLKAFLPTEPSPNATRTYSEAERLASELFFYPLITRLTQFSFQAAVMKARNIAIDQLPTPEQMARYGKNFEDDMRARKEHLPPGVSQKYVPTGEPSLPGPSWAPYWRPPADELTPGPSGQSMRVPPEQLGLSAQRAPVELPRPKRKFRFDDEEEQEPSDGPSKKRRN